MIFRSSYPDISIPSQPLPEFVLQRAVELADKAAFIEGQSERIITYGQLADSIRRVAAGLTARGFSKGDVFAIYSPNLPEYAIAFHAVVSLGGVVSTLRRQRAEGRRQKEPTLKNVGFKQGRPVPRATRLVTDFVFLLRMNPWAWTRYGQSRSEGIQLRYNPSHFLLPSAFCLLPCPKGLSTHPIQHKS